MKRGRERGWKGANEEGKRRIFSVAYMLRSLFSLVLSTHSITCSGRGQETCTLYSSIPIRLSDNQVVRLSYGQIVRQSRCQTVTLSDSQSFSLHHECTFTCTHLSLVANQMCQLRWQQKVCKEREHAVTYTCTHV